MDIILIGMPGCGKTTIGRRLAKQLNMEFVDIDEQIEKAEGRKISDIFDSDGEEYFRKIETYRLEEALGKNRVISTGGGIVVTKKNIDILKQTEGSVVFIDRPVENIMGDVRTDMRPLLKDGKGRLLKLYSERYDKYTDACDIRILNTGTLNNIVIKIIDEVNDYENNGD